MTVHVASDEAASVDIPLIANGTVAGRVVDEAGKPLSGMPVALIADQPPGPGIRINITEEPTTTGADGRFQVAGPPGVRTLVILGRTPTPKRGISVTAGNTVDVENLGLWLESVRGTAQVGGFGAGLPNSITGDTLGVHVLAGSVGGPVFLDDNTIASGASGAGVQVIDSVAGFTARGNGITAGAQGGIVVNQVHGGAIQIGAAGATDSGGFL